jgi:hypothetical protein
MEPYITTCYLRTVATVSAFEPVSQTFVTDTDDACITILPFGTVGDLVWDDLDGDGARDAGEPGLGGVTVRLLSGAAVVATTTTSSTGSYSFNGLKAGAYAVDPEGAPGRVLTTGNDPLALNLAAGQRYTAADFGYQLAP